ncbi:hypothetical protein RHSIM_RhsimUnG0103700 [Rhododendron simsii]|uniref:Uncharacterized protein n=1 Tax=Rhododendron simsii TaxID=118357 RepID=A0A834FVT8_RHOSS|nr:hypothetical protein RHSIM_RhsimUnG0103700 [Rhododendron simsii]
MKPSQQSHSSLCVDLTVCDGAGGYTVGDGGGVDDEGVDRSVKLTVEMREGVYQRRGSFPADVSVLPWARGENYLDIDVDIGNSVIANEVLNGDDGGHETEEELWERLFGAVRVCLVEMSTAMVVDRVVRERMRSAFVERFWD